MSDLFYFILIIFLVLIQVSLLPLNLAFSAVWSFSLFGVKESFVVWLLVLSVTFALLSNLNFGLVLLVFSTSFLILKFLNTILPRNNTINWLLVVFSLLVSEIAFLSFNYFLK